MSTEVYVDMRCLQDPNYSFRGVGYHSSTLLSAGRSYFPKATKWIGLVDHDLPALPAAYMPLVDYTTELNFPKANDANKLFVQLSPMTHDGEFVQRFLAHQDTFSIAAIYDFIPLDMQERYLPTSHLQTEYLQRLGWLGLYDSYSAISSYSAKRLIELAGVRESQVSVSGVALRPEFEAMLDLSSESSYSIDEPYFLFVGGGDPRKNLDTVLKSHAACKKEGTPKLVVVGGYKGKLADQAMEKYSRFGGKTSRLKLMTDVSDLELAELYRHCVATICASEIEGFSLPPVESLACGRPVIVSRNEAHAEFITDEDFTFDSQDHSRLTHLMQKMHQNPDFAQRAYGDHHLVPTRFKLERVAQRFWSQATAGVRALTTTRARNLAAGQRKKLAVLTPFPPDRSGVADYTRRSIEEIGKLVDVDVYCENDSPLPTAGVRNFYPLSATPYISGSYDAVLSVIGNSHFHIRIIEAQVEHGGPCLIHDNRLAELYNWWKGPIEFQELASKSMGRKVGFEEAQEWVRNPGTLPSLFYDELIPKADPLILHSRGIVKNVKRQYGVDAEYLPFCVYRDFNEEILSAASRSAARKRLGIKDDEVAIITLGLVSSHKAPDRCIEAISILRESGINAHLYFVGSAAGEEATIEKMAKANGTEGAIHLCGDWIDENEYTDYVLAADLAIQLRTHFFGGLSGAMLDCIASGLVTVANEDLAEAMDSPETVLRVSDAILSKDVADSLLKAINIFDLSDRFSAARKEYVRSHSFQVYAQKFCKLLNLTESNLCEAAA